MRYVNPIIAVSLTQLACGCGLYTSPPDQSQFPPLEPLRDSNQALARIYVAPVPGFELLAVHTWFIIKQADETTFHRWEVWPVDAEPYAFVRQDLFPPETDAGAGGVYILAERVGQSAQSVVDIITDTSPTYPCQDLYIGWPGPNSNTYTQWILNNTDWNVPLPLAAVGKDFAPLCQ